LLKVLQDVLESSLIDIVNVISKIYDVNFTIQTMYVIRIGCNGIFRL
jgi:hypothetical protein